MRKVGLVLVVLALAVGFGLPADAGGKGATKVALYVGHYPTDGLSEITQPPAQVGHVVFNATASGKMKVTIALKDGEPNTTFNAFIVRLRVWGSLADQGYTMTTNKKGKATLHFSRDIPDDADDPVFIKAIIRTNDGRGDDDFVYVTDEHYIDLKK